MSAGFKQHYTAVLAWLRGCILSTTNADQAIRLARFYGEMKYANTDGAYFDDAVEAHVETLYLDEEGSVCEQAARDAGEGVMLIASELYDLGGHTPVVHKWLELAPGGRPHKLAVTRSLSRRNREVLDALDCDVRVCAEYTARAITNVIAHARGTKIVVLHIHPDDIVGATAASVLKRAGYRTIFYNHADHCFAYGIRGSDYSAEISHFGAAISKRTQRTGQASGWLGIPVSLPPDLHAMHDKAPPADNVVMACGSPMKFRPADGLFFGDFIDGVLAASADARFSLVGPSGDEPWWRATRERWGGRVSFMGILPRAEYLAALQRALVFVDGFPAGGGTSFIEAVVSGKRCTGLALPMNGYSPSDVLRVTTVPELVERTRLLLEGRQELLANVQQVRDDILATLGADAFRERIEGIYLGNCRNCVNPFDNSLPGDSRWYELAWEKESRVLLPMSGGWPDLPLSFRLQFLWKLLPRIRDVPPRNLLRALAGGARNKTPA